MENAKGNVTFCAGKDVSGSKKAGIAEDVVKFSDASPLVSVYDDPEVLKAQPFSPELNAAVEQSTSRPVSPVYPQISQAVYKNVNAALSGQTSPEEALKKAQVEADKALETF